MKKILFAVLIAVVLGVASLGAYAMYNQSGDKYKTFVKTKFRCGNDNCQCSGYWGYKHYNGTYEGNCSNSDGFGHTCGHGPEKHGLRKW